MLPKLFTPYTAAPLKKTLSGLLLWTWTFSSASGRSQWERGDRWPKTLVSLYLKNVLNLYPSPYLTYLLGCVLFLFSSSPLLWWPLTVFQRENMSVCPNSPRRYLSAFELGFSRLPGFFSLLAWVWYCLVVFKILSGSGISCRQNPSKCFF